MQDSPAQKLFQKAQAELCLPVRPVTVCLIDPGQKVKLPERLRGDFKALAIEDWSQRIPPRQRKLVRDAFRVLEVHHIVPRYLGGNNHHTNLVLVDPKVHEKIHDMIRLQTSDMERGEERTIMLPVLPHALVWGVDKSALKRWRHISSEQRNLITIGLQREPTIPLLRPAPTRPQEAAASGAMIVHTT